MAKLRFHTAEKDHIVWKKVRDRNYNYYLIECLLPKGTEFYGFINKSKSRTSHVHGRKNRAEFLIPLIIYKNDNGWHKGRQSEWKLVDKKSITNQGLMGGAKPMRYTIGKKAKPNGFSRSHSQCDRGAHFFFFGEDAIRL